MNSNQVFDKPETSALPKFSRYRSVRRAAVNDVQQTSPPPLPISKANKTPSRYHRKHSSSSEPTQSPNTTSLPPPVRSGHATSNPNAHLVPQSAKHSEVVEKKESRPNKLDRENFRSKAALPKETQFKYGGEKRLHSQSSREVSSGSWPSVGMPAHQAAREEARMILEGEMDRLNKLKRQQTAQRVAQPQSYNTTVHHKQAQPACQINDNNQVETSMQGEKRRQRAEEDKGRELVKASNTEHPSTLRKAIVKESVIPRLHKDGSRPMNHQPQGSEISDHSSQQADEPKINVVEYSEPQAKNKFDAPLSAVNAGDRRIQIRRNEALITLPITPTTTVKQVLNSASLCMSEKFDPRTAILVESFSQLGLERPLRKYERIRDVLNSWENDSQNYLAISTSEEVTAVGIELEDAPRTQALEVSVQMYHSPKPGKWDKRWIRLQVDGQVIVLKRANDLEGTKICHMSDFDLYVPTKKQTKKLRPPKKICLAVKSQQKSAMFLNGANFAHFFCSNDKGIIDQWYHAVQSWRSWYLVNILGEGQPKPSDSRTSVERPQRASMAMSRDSVPYQLGSFKPLLDVNNLDTRNHDEANADLNNFNRKTNGNAGKPLLDFGTERRSLDIGDGSPKRNSRSQGLPPSSFPKKLGFDSAEVKSSATDEMQPFTGSGLLARSASRRSQGGQASGRGVRGIAGKPLVDISAHSEFTDGSLLRQVEAWYIDNGGAEPRIDREKRREAMTAVGENV